MHVGLSSQLGYDVSREDIQDGAASAAMWFKHLWWYLEDAKTLLSGLNVEWLSNAWSQLSSTLVSAWSSAGHLWRRITEEDDDYW